MSLSITRPFLKLSSDAATTVAVPSLIAISHAIEDVIAEGIDDAELAVGFQRIDAFRQQEQRYRGLAAACRRVSICAVADAAPPTIAGLCFVPIRAEWPVADEWFIVVNAPGFACAMLAVEVADNLGGQGRCFQTMFTSDPRLVNAICRTLEIELDVQVASPATRDAEAQQRNLRRFNELALSYQQRRTPPRAPLPSGLPSWTPPTGLSRQCGERLAGA